MSELFGDNYKKAIVNSLPEQIPYAFFGTKVQTAYEEYTCTGLEAANDTLKVFRMPLNCKLVDFKVLSDGNIGDVTVDVGDAVDADRLLSAVQINAAELNSMSDSVATMASGFMQNLGDQSVGTDVTIDYNANGRDIVVTFSAVATAPTAGSVLKFAVTYLEL